MSDGQIPDEILRERHKASLLGLELRVQNAKIRLMEMEEEKRKLLANQADALQQIEKLKLEIEK